MTANHPVARIHLNHIKANFERVKQLVPGKRLMAVIKADAYGHGVGRVAEQLKSANAYAVARVDEAIQLRLLQPNKSIVVLEGFLDSAEATACHEYQLTPVLHSDYQLSLLPDGLPVWIKFNTGMFRLGFEPSSADRLAERIKAQDLQGIMSHFANADDPGHELNQRQISLFAQCAEAFPKAARCFGNSGAVIGIPEGVGDWARPGLMLFGGAPSGDALPELSPGMTLSAPVIAINKVQAGDAVGYGGLWVAKRPSRVAVIALGYADGYPREMPENTPVLINGQRRSLIGRVSMDMCTVLLEDGDIVQPGDHGVFWGKNLPIDEVASAAGTISYTLMTGLGQRVVRVFDDL
ncbi:MAG: alanine racemase [Candidatus Azotimanducaceae bacterium]|jgi:alanine racemase